MKTFTFGFAHRCSCGLSLGSCYTELPSRARMVELWGVKWAFEYDSPEDAGAERWGLTRIETNESDKGCRCSGMGRVPIPGADRADDAG